MHITRVVLIGFVGGCTLALAACGSSSKETADTPDAPVVTVTATKVTRSEYIAAADAVCASYETKINTASEKIPVDVDASEIAQAEQNAILPLQQQELAALQALPAPADDVATLNKIWARADTAMQAETQDFEGVNTELSAFGLQECAF
jgi:hypothetical protein